MSARWPGVSTVFWLWSRRRSGSCSEVSTNHRDSYTTTYRAGFSNYRYVGVATAEAYAGRAGLMALYAALVSHRESLVLPQRAACVLAFWVEYSPMVFRLTPEDTCE